MKKTYFVPIYLLVAMGFSSCALVEGIFKAGVWVGVLAVAAVVGLIIFLIMKMSGKK